MTKQITYKSEMEFNGVNLTLEHNGEELEVHYITDNWSDMVLNEIYGEDICGRRRSAGPAVVEQFVREQLIANRGEFIKRAEFCTSENDMECAALYYKLAA